MEPKTGKPVGCGELTSEKWQETPWKLSADASSCPKQDIESNDGKQPVKMYEIVEQYATVPNAWINDFVPAMEKMLSNGARKLHESFDFTGLTCNVEGGGK